MAKTGKIRLIYFDTKGLGEIARIIMASTGKVYEDVRLPSPSSPEWQEMKPTMPIESLPVLEVDGVMYPESVAICNYLAKEFGLYGKTVKDQLIIDIVMQVHRDIAKVHAGWAFLPEEDSREEKKQEALKETQKYLKYLESLLAKNDNGYFLGNGITLADIALFDALTGFSAESLEWDSERFPWVNRNKERVMKHWRIGQYVNARDGN